FAYYYFTPFLLLYLSFRYSRALYSFPTRRSSDLTLLDAYLDAVPDSKPLLTHAGGFLAWYNETYGTTYTFSNIDSMPIPPKNSPDRKSTRLNSSHVKISYAVFCLKKKKKFFVLHA